MRVPTEKMLMALAFQLRERVVSLLRNQKASPDWEALEATLPSLVGWLQAMSQVAVQQNLRVERLPLATQSKFIEQRRKVFFADTGLYEVVDLMIDHDVRTGDGSMHKPFFVSFMSAVKRLEERLG
jgi:hypothetical protein